MAVLKLPIKKYLINCEEKWNASYCNYFENGIVKPLEFKIIRDAIPLYSLDASYMVNATIGYIKISKFAATTMKNT